MSDLSQKNLGRETAHDIYLHASDYVPNINEAQSLTESLEEQNKFIRELDSRIGFLEAQLEELRAHRVALLESSATKTALLAPVRRLAPETLGEIFEWCTPVSSLPARCPITSSSTPLLLGQVCGRWRRVALGTPQLWTRISLERTTMATSEVNPLVVIPTWLRRSGCLPIDIYLGEGLEQLYYTKDVGKIFQSCLRLLSDNFHRCRSFQATDSSILLSVFPAGHCTKASYLRDLRIVRSTSSPQPHLILGEIAAPHLESMDVCRPYTFLDSITMDYSLLRTLRWIPSTNSRDPAPTLEALTRVLRLCVNLEECDIMHPPHDENSSAEARMVSLPKLRRLSLKFTLHADPSPLFTVLETPALDFLALEQVSPISDAPGLGTALNTLVSTTSPQLRELHMTRVILSFNDAILLSPLSSLESLQLDQCFLHVPFLAALTPNIEEKPGAWMLPKLSSLTLVTSAFDVAELANMIQSRVSVPDVLDANPSYSPNLSHVSLVRCRLSPHDGKLLTRVAESHEKLRIDVMEPDQAM